MPYNHPISQISAATLPFRQRSTHPGHASLSLLTPMPPIVAPSYSQPRCGPPLQLPSTYHVSMPSPGMPSLPPVSFLTYHHLPPSQHTSLLNPHMPDQPSKPSSLLLPLSHRLPNPSVETPTSTRPHSRLCLPRSSLKMNSKLPATSAIDA